MYEEMTYENIMNRMLARVPDSFDKREGSVIFDALAPAAFELSVLYTELETTLDQTFADTCSGEYLDKRCAERGIIREMATFTVVQGSFDPTDVDVSGYRFNCGDYNYKVQDKVSDGVYTLICETAGSFPNGVTGQMIPIDYINGLESALITEILIPGEDEETDDHLRERYFSSLESQSYGGNIADYKQKTNAIAGVGGVKVTPIWNGGGTVKLTVIASDFTAPSSTLISKVQEEMTAIAPIGHVVTVDGVLKKVINISTVITYQSGWNWDTSKTYIQKAIDIYFEELAEKWDSSENLIVRISQIETRILDCAGVIDISGTIINEKAENFVLEKNEIPVRGSVSDGT